MWMIERRRPWEDDGCEGRLDWEDLSWSSSSSSILWVWGIGVDDVPSVFPDGLETTLEPSELALEAICPEFAEEATDIGGVCDGMESAS
jgi:hypothetical protein